VLLIPEANLPPVLLMVHKIENFLAPNLNFILFHCVSFSDDEFVIGPCRSTATHDNDRK
jgi:hypothetical protein